MKAFWVGFPGWMKANFTAVFLLQKHIALLVNSVPLSQVIDVGSWRCSPSCSKKRATWWPVMETDTSCPTLSLVKSSTILSTRNRLPWLNWSETKSIDQRWFGWVGTIIGNRGRCSFLRFFVLTYKLAQKEGQPLTKFGPHDLRRTASTLLHEAGYNTDWIEKCLAHEQKGVRAIYNKAEYRDQRTAMLQDWADMIDEWVVK